MSVDNFTVFVFIISIIIFLFGCACAAYQIGYGDGKLQSDLVHARDTEPRLRTWYDSPAHYTLMLAHNEIPLFELTGINTEEDMEIVIDEI